MKILTSWDDGCAEDFKMAELLKKYELPGIFFIPTVTLLTVEEIKNLSHTYDIGGHTTTHPADMKLLSDRAAYNEVHDNKIWLEEVIGKEVEWFCYPKGRYNQNTIEQVKKAGFKYARTTDIGNVLPCEPYRIRPAAHAYHRRKENEGVHWVTKAMQLYTLAKNSENSYYHIWGHSWEVEGLGLWDELEELFKFIHADQRS